MLGIVLGLASSIAWGTSDFLGGLQARRIAALSVLLVSQPVGLALAVVVALIFGGSALSGSDAALAIAAGAIIVVSLGAFYRAMALGSVSIVATIGALGVLVPVIAGLVQGEHPAAIQLIGAVLAIAGVVAVAREPDPEWRAAGRASVGLAAFAALGFGTFFWLLDLSAGPEPAWTIVLARAQRRRDPARRGGVRARLDADPARDGYRRCVAIGVCDVTANSLFAVATNHGLLSLVAVAGSMYGAVTVLLARVVLGERLARARQAGVVSRSPGWR